MTEKKTYTKQLFSLLIPHTGRLSLGILAMLLTTACMMVIPQYLKTIFDTALQNKDMAQLNSMTLWVMLTVVFLVIGIFARTYFIQYSALLILDKLRLQVFKHLLYLDIGFFEGRKVGELVSRTIADITAMRQFIQQGLPTFARGVLLTIGSLIGLFYTNWPLTLVLLVFIPAIMVPSVLVGRHIRKVYKAMFDAFAQLSGVMHEALSSIRTVAAFGQNMREYARGEAHTAKMIQLARRHVMLQGGFFSFNIFIGFGALFLVIWLGGRDVIQGEMTLGGMMSYLLYLGFLADGTSSIGNFWPSLQNALGSTERVFELLDEEAAIQPSNHI